MRNIEKIEKNWYEREKLRTLEVICGDIERFLQSSKFAMQFELTPIKWSSRLIAHNLFCSSK